MPCDIGTIPWLEREHHHAYQTIREVLVGSARRLNGTSGKALLREAVENNEMFRLETWRRSWLRNRFCVLLVLWMPIRRRTSTVHPWPERSGPLAGHSFKASFIRQTTFLQTTGSQFPMW